MACKLQIRTFKDAVSAVKGGTIDLDQATAYLLSELSLEERLWLLDGDEEFWIGMHAMMTEGFCHTPCVMGQLERIDYPGVRFCDGPRGCIMGKSTAFPAAMARGATWDVDLEERVGRAIGLESKAQGANMFGGVCVNVPRHPAWGRIQETYGEDPILLGQMGAAIVRGVQENLMACVKHYALNSMENSRFKVDVEVAEDVLHEVYLPQFRLIVEQGVSVVMSAYNSVRGEWAGHSKELLTDILREQWGFKGFVCEDFIFGFRDVASSLRNGLDLEAPFRQQRAQHLESALIDGTVTEKDIDRSGGRILRSLVENEVKRGHSQPGLDIVFSEAHRALAREAATKSMVLLKNENVSGGLPSLPLEISTVSKIAVVGWLADSTNTGDKGSSAVRCPRVISSYQGIKDTLPDVEVILEDSSDLEKVSKAAASADVVVVVVGYDFRDEGEYTAPGFNGTPGLKHVIPPDDGSEEANAVITRLVKPKPKKSDQGKDNYGFGAGGDRRQLGLRPGDVDVIRATAQANRNTIVSIVAGGAVIIDEWKDLVPTIIYGWYAGCEGGFALADLLLGKANFAGRLPFSIPTSERHLPKFDNDAECVIYDRWYGQKLLDRLKVKAAYPLGFGLSYTTFSLDGLEVSKSDVGNDRLMVHVTVLNTGPRAGRYVAQVYGVVKNSQWPIRSLLGFTAVDLEVAQSRDVDLGVSTQPLRRWSNGSWELVDTSPKIEIGSFSGDPDSLVVEINLESR